MVDARTDLEATIRREMERLATTQQQHLAGTPLRDGLIAFGCELMHFLTGPEAVRFYSVLAGELGRHPDLARRFYAWVPARPTATSQRSSRRPST